MIIDSLKNNEHTGIRMEGQTDVKFEIVSEHRADITGTLESKLF